MSLVADIYGLSASEAMSLSDKEVDFLLSKAQAKLMDLATTSSAAQAIFRKQLQPTIDSVRSSRLSRSVSDTELSGNTDGGRGSRANRSDRGNGNTITEQRPAHEFDRITVSSGLKVTLVKDDLEISITGESNLLQLIETRVENGQLFVGMRSGVSIHPTREISINASTQVLRSIVVRAGSDVVVRGFSEQKVTIDVHGGSQLKATEVDIGKTTVHATAGSQIEVVGSGDWIEITETGGGVVNTRGFQVDRADISLAAGADTSVYASVCLRGKVTTGARLEVWGNPEDRNVLTDSGGSVRYRS